LIKKKYVISLKNTVCVLNMAWFDLCLKRLVQNITGLVLIDWILSTLIKKFLNISMSILNFTGFVLRMTVLVLNKIALVQLILSRAAIILRMTGFFMTSRIFLLHRTWIILNFIQVVLNMTGIWPIMTYYSLIWHR
jgi:hypothetical protein